MPQLIPSSTTLPAVAPVTTPVRVVWGVAPLFDYSQSKLLFSDSNDLLLGNEGVTLSQRIISCLTTKRLYYQFYAAFFGSDFHTLIGQNYPPEIIKSFAEKFIKQAVTDDRVTNVKNIVVQVTGKIVTVNFTVVAVSGYEKQFQARWSV